MAEEKNDEITFNIQHSPTYASLVLELKRNQTILVESSAMAARDSCLTMKSKIRGSFLAGLGKTLAEESFFISEFTTEKSGKLYISPGLPGDIQHYYLTNQCGLMIQSSAFVACSTTVEINGKFEGSQEFLSGESLFLLQVSGTGDVWFSSYGSIIEIPIEDDYIVDTGYLVAFEDTLEYQIGRIDGLSWKGLQSNIFGGEGLICRFNGKGRLWIQSRNLYSLLNFLNPFRPSKS